VQVLLLEPDRWRFLGLSQVLRSDPDIRLLGTEDAARIISLRAPPVDLKPDVLIVSHSLVVDSGLTVLTHLHNLFPGKRLLLQGYDQNLPTIAALLKAGADGYFLLTADTPALLKAVRAVGDGEIWAPRGAVALMSSSTVEPQLLSPPEVAVLRLLETGLSNKEIARRLQVAPVTVKAHLTKLYRRFGVKTRLELLAYAVSHRLFSPRHLFRS
jgi:DNA-binding NarL/FixJ family response regulator